MTRLIARLVLAMLILPLTGAVTLLCFGALLSRGQPGYLKVAACWLVVYAFIAIYWMLLWRDMVLWTRRRKWMTLAAFMAAVLIGACFWAAFAYLVHEREAAFFFSGGVPPIVWVLATVLIWRETPQERMARIATLGTDSVSCPVCGYNLTGLREARCPECGASFTLDQLLAGQPARDQAILEMATE